MLQDVSFRIKTKKKWQKNNKRNIKSYQPVCLISIRRELFIFNKIFSLFLGNNFTSPKQSGFKPGYSCINKLFWITLEIYKSCDDGLEVRSVSWTFLRLSIKSGTRELFFKLKENGVSGELLHIISNFWATGNKGLCWMDKCCLGTMSRLVILMSTLTFLININGLSKDLSSKASTSY